MTLQLKRWYCAVCMAENGEGLDACRKCGLSREYYEASPILISEEVDRRRRKEDETRRYNRYFLIFGMVALTMGLALLIIQQIIVPAAKESTAQMHDCVLAGGTYYDGHCFGAKGAGR